MQTVRRPDHGGNGDKPPARRSGFSRNPLAGRLLRSLRAERVDAGSVGNRIGDRTSAHKVAHVSANVAPRRSRSVGPWWNGRASSVRAGASQLENSADAILKPVSRSKSGNVSRRSRGRPGRSGGNARAGSNIRLALVMFLAAAVFLVGFICDTGALTRLFWASLAGQVGLSARLGAFGVLLLVVSVFVLGLTRPTKLPPPKPRRTATPRTARDEEQKPPARAADTDPAVMKPAVTRGRRKKPGAALNQPS